MDEQYESGESAEKNFDLHVANTEDRSHKVGINGVSDNLVEQAIRDNDIHVLDMIATTEILAEFDHFSGPLYYPEQDLNFVLTPKAANRELFDDAEVNDDNQQHLDFEDQQDQNSGKLDPMEQYQMGLPDPEYLPESFHVFGYEDIQQREPQLNSTPEHYQKPTTKADAQNVPRYQESLLNATEHLQFQHQSPSYAASQNYQNHESSVVPVNQPQIESPAIDAAHHQQRHAVEIPAEIQQNQELRIYRAPELQQLLGLEGGLFQEQSEGVEETHNQEEDDFPSVVKSFSNYHEPSTATNGIVQQQLQQQDSFPNNRQKDTPTKSVDTNEDKKSPAKEALAVDEDSISSSKGAVAVVEYQESISDNADDDEEDGYQNSLIEQANADDGPQDNPIESADAVKKLQESPPRGSTAGEDHQEFFTDVVNDDDGFPKSSSEESDVDAGRQDTPTTVDNAVKKPSMSPPKGATAVEEHQKCITYDADENDDGYQKSPTEEAHAAGKHPWSPSEKLDTGDRRQITSIKSVHANEDHQDSFTKKVHDVEGRQETSSKGADNVDRHQEPLIDNEDDNDRFPKSSSEEPDAENGQQKAFNRSDNAAAKHRKSPSKDIKFTNDAEDYRDSHSKHVDTVDGHLKSPSKENDVVDGQPNLPSKDAAKEHQVFPTKGTDTVEENRNSPIITDDVVVCLCDFSIGDAAVEQHQISFPNDFATGMTATAKKRQEPSNDETRKIAKRQDSPTNLTIAVDQHKEVPTNEADLDELYPINQYSTGNLATTDGERDMFSVGDVEKNSKRQSTHKRKHEPDGRAPEDSKRLCGSNHSISHARSSSSQLLGSDINDNVELDNGRDQFGQLQGPSSPMKDMAYNESQALENDGQESQELDPDKSDVAALPRNAENDSNESISNRKRSRSAQPGNFDSGRTTNDICDKNSRPTRKRLRKKIPKRDEQTMIAIQKENNFPTKLPEYHNSFVQRVWRTIERAWYNLSTINEKTLEIPFFEKSGENHLENSPFRFHVRFRHDDETNLYKELQKIATVDYQRNVPDIWDFYGKKPEEVDKKAVLIAENSFLRLFKNTIITKKEFRNMKWSVPQRNGQRIQAIEFFTNLGKFRNVDLYENYLHSRELPFKFNVYRHIWFMGALAPQTYCADTHRSSEVHRCAGCTQGDVIIVENCSCGFSDHLSKTCITKISNCRLTKVLLIGRFVCEHGPSSHLVLETIDPVGEDPSSMQLIDEKWNPDSSRYTSFDASLRIIKRRSMYDQLVETLLGYGGSPENLRPPNFEDSEDEDFEDKTEHISRETVVSTANNQQIVRRFGASKTRSKSAEPRPKKKEPECAEFVKRCHSRMDFSEMTKYAKKKTEFTKKMFCPEVNTNGVCEFPFRDNDLMNPHSLFNGVSSATDVQKYRVIASMLGYGENEIANCESFFRRISRDFKNKGLLNLVGEPISLASDRDVTRPIGKKKTSNVLELHRQFAQFKKQQTERAKILMADNFEKVESQFGSFGFETLTKCYKNIFKFNLYLINHYLDLVESQAFNLYAVYQAERDQNTDFMKKGVQKIMNQTPNVINAYLNIKPLERQLRDLCAISSKRSAGVMERYEARLCHFATRQIRVPQTVEPILDKWEWVNFTTTHQDNIKVSKISVKKTTPSNINEKEYLEKAAKRKFYPEFLQKQATSFLTPKNNKKNKKSVAGSIFLAFFQQSQDFYESIKGLMPNGRIDPKMMIFYRSQVVQMLFSVIFKQTYYPTAEDCQRMGAVHTSILIPAIIEQQIKAECSLTTMIDISNVFMNSFCGEPLPIYPSTIGVSFNCFDKRLVVSIVEECRNIVKNERIIGKGSKLDRHEIMKLKSLQGSDFHVIVDKISGKLSMSFFHSNNSYKGDRFDVATLPRGFIDPDIQWGDITDKYIEPKLNCLNKILNKVPLRDEIYRLGRLECPTERMYPARNNFD